MKDLLQTYAGNLSSFYNENALLISSRLFDENNTPMDL